MGFRGLATAALLSGIVAGSVPASVDAAQVACLPREPDPQTVVVYRVRPTTCTFRARNAEIISANLLSVYKLRWRHWARAKAIGRGEVRAEDNYRSPVTVTLSRRSNCLGHVRYGRATFRYPDGHHATTVLDTCTDEND